MCTSPPQLKWYDSRWPRRARPPQGRISSPHQRACIPAVRYRTPRIGVPALPIRAYSVCNAPVAILNPNTLQHSRFPTSILPILVKPSLLVPSGTSFASRKCPGRCRRPPSGAPDYEHQRPEWDLCSAIPAPSVFVVAPHCSHCGLLQRRLATVHAPTLPGQFPNLFCSTLRLPNAYCQAGVAARTVCALVATLSPHTVSVTLTVRDRPWFLFPMLPVQPSPLHSCLMLAPRPLLPSRPQAPLMEQSR